jgi:hypothetical protein
MFPPADKPYRRFTPHTEEWMIVSALDTEPPWGDPEDIQGNLAPEIAAQRLVALPEIDPQ